MVTTREIGRSGCLDPLYWCVPGTSKSPGGGQPACGAKMAQHVSELGQTVVPTALGRRQ